MWSALALISHSRQKRRFIRIKWTIVEHKLKHKSGEMVPGRRQLRRFPLKPNYYFLVHLQCSLKFACKFITWYLHQVDKLTRKSLRKQLISFAQEIKFLWNIKLKRGFLTPTPPPLRTPLGRDPLFAHACSAALHPSNACFNFSEHWSRRYSFSILLVIAVSVLSKLRAHIHFWRHKENRRVHTGLHAVMYCRQLHL